MSNYITYVAHACGVWYLSPQCVLHVPPAHKLISFQVKGAIVSSLTHQEN